MTRKQVQTWLDEQGINCHTINLCVPTDDDGNSIPGSEDGGACVDPWFGRCDISGERGNLYRCVAITKDDALIDFDAGDWLISGPLGKIAGAF